MPVATVLPFRVVVLVAPDTLEPTAILVVLPAAPLVPILIVLVEPLAVTLAATLIIWLTVDRPRVMVPVPVLAPMDIVPEVEVSVIGAEVLWIEMLPRFDASVMYEDPDWIFTCPEGI